MGGKRTYDHESTPLGEFLFEARKAAGHWSESRQEMVPLPFREVKERTGGLISSSFLSSLEKGQRKALRDPGKLRALSTALGVSYEQLARLAGYEGINEPQHSLTMALRDMGASSASIEIIKPYVKHVIDEQRKAERAAKRSG